MVAIPAFIYETVLMRRTGPPPGLLNAVPALEGLTCELARKGRANIAEAKLRCPTNLGTSLTVELSRRSVARDLPFSAMGVTRVTVGFSDLFYN
jgi:hypothetical protein